MGLGTRKDQLCVTLARVSMLGEGKRVLMKSPPLAVSFLGHC